MTDYEQDEIIERLARNIIDAYDIPVPISNMGDVVGHIGGRIEIYADMKGYGVAKEGDGFVIRAQKGYDTRAHKYHVARQIGHLIIHMGYTTSPYVWSLQKNNAAYRALGRTIEKERRADKFALALLMPRREFILTMSEYLEGEYVDIRKVARYFDVPQNMATLRGETLGCIRKAARACSIL